MSAAAAWRATEYDALPLPHEGWGQGVRQRLGDVRAAGPGPLALLDAGCGTGRDLAALGDAHPGARLVGLDVDAAMLSAARDAVAGQDATLVQADLSRPLPPQVLTSAGAPVDAITSVAAFHWVLPTHALAANLAALLRPRGRLVAECGGAGQLAAVDAALVSLGARSTHDVAFRDEQVWGRALESAGFAVQRVALRPDPLVLPDVEVLARYLEVVVLRLHVAALPEAERTAFARAVAELLPDRAVDYVRLEVEAVLREDAPTADRAAGAGGPVGG